jgi:hypothetical protein
LYPLAGLKPPESAQRDSDNVTTKTATATKNIESENKSVSSMGVHVARSVMFVKAGGAMNLVKKLVQPVTAVCDDNKKSSLNTKQQHSRNSVTDSSNSSSISNSSSGKSDELVATGKSEQQQNNTSAVVKPLKSTKNDQRAAGSAVETTKKKSSANKELRDTDLISSRDRRAAVNSNSDDNLYENYEYQHDYHHTIADMVADKSSERPSSSASTSSSTSSSSLPSSSPHYVQSLSRQNRVVFTSSSNSNTISGGCGGLSESNSVQLYPHANGSGGSIPLDQHQLNVIFVFNYL